MTNDRINDLEHLIHEALEKGAPSISLVRDPEGRYQCSVGRKQSGVFGVHIANHPIEAMFGALGGVDAVQAFRERGITTNAPRMTYWYHPESDCVWEEMSDRVSSNMGDGLSHEISEEDYRKHLVRIADEITKGVSRPIVVDPDLEDLL